MTAAFGMLVLFGKFPTAAEHNIVVCAFYYIQFWVFIQPEYTEKFRLIAS